MSTTLTTNGPQFVVPYRPDRGGVDFLGMRQVNVDMMAGVLPGINNVTWWIRPFSLVSWIYWKFYHLAGAAGIAEPTGEQLRIWKEKVEVLFTWGHKLQGWQGLPGISFNPPASGAVSLAFSDWGRTAINTSLMAAVQITQVQATLDGDRQPGGAERPARPRRRMSAAGRKRIAEAQKKRWAQAREEVTKPKRKLSAAGRKAIAEAARKRWAAVRAKKAGATAAKRRAKAETARRAVPKRAAAKGAAPSKESALAPATAVQQ